MGERVSAQQFPGSPSSAAYASDQRAPGRLDARSGQYEPATVLRWQNPDVNAFQSKYGVRPAAHDDRGGSSGVQPAIQFAPSGPFSDPFGDRLAQDPAPANPLLPAPALPELQPQAAPSPSNGRFTPGAAAEPCDRIYNDRNCCTDDKDCDRIRELLRNSRITNISVDITPAFRPETGTFYSTEDLEPGNGDRADNLDDSRAARLALAGPRTWRNQQGQIIAEGRWTDYRYGRLYISRGDGEVVQIPASDLSDDDLCFVNAWWSLPSECTLGAEPFLGRQFVQTTFTWKASALCHKPLYFEELQLERYGHTAGPVFQPIFSGAHFFASIAFLPYKMGINPPNECIYQLGLYRPGSCAPWLAEPFPISLRGAAFQTGAVLGGVFLLP